MAFLCILGWLGGLRTVYDSQATNRSAPGRGGGSLTESPRCILLVAWETYVTPSRMVMSVYRASRIRINFWRPTIGSPSACQVAQFCQVRGHNSRETAPFDRTVESSGLCRWHIRIRKWSVELQHSSPARTTTLLESLLTRVGLVLRQHRVLVLNTSTLELLLSGAWSPPTSIQNIHRHFSSCKDD